MQKNYKNTYHTLLTQLFSPSIYHFFNSCPVKHRGAPWQRSQSEISSEVTGCWVSNILWPLVRPMFLRHFKNCYSKNHFKVLHAKCRPIIVGSDHQFKTTKIWNEVLHHQNKLSFLRFEAWSFIYSWAITQTIWQIAKLFFYKESCFQTKWFL